MHNFWLFLLVLALSGCFRCEEGNEKGYVQYDYIDDSYTTYHPSCAFGDYPSMPPDAFEDSADYPYEYSEYGTVQVNGASPEATSDILHFSNEMRKKHHLELENSLIFYNLKIESFMLDYSSMDPVELCEAREIIVDVVEGFLQRINNNKALVEKMEEPPFTFGDLEIYISYKSFYGIYVNPLLIGDIILQNGCVYYYTFEHLDRYLDSWHCHVEPYPKTLEIVKVQREIEAEELQHVKPPERTIHETRIQLQFPQYLPGQGPPIPGRPSGAGQPPAGFIPQQQYPGAVPPAYPQYPYPQYPYPYVPTVPPATIVPGAQTAPGAPTVPTTTNIPAQAPAPSETLPAGAPPAPAPIPLSPPTFTPVTTPTPPAIEAVPPPPASSAIEAAPPLPANSIPLTQPAPLMVTPPLPPVHP